jgi:type VI secretion system secreted protein VgrG
MNRFLTAGTPLEADLVLLRMSGREELGRLPAFELEFTSPRSGIKANEILGKNVSWALELANREHRYFNGFVTRFSEAGQAGTAAFEQSRKGLAYLYRASVSPWLWFLTRASHSRIFENMSAVEVVQRIVSDYSGDLKKQLSGKYATRLYIVQYRETDFNFVCRLLEQEGIYFAFEYDNGRNTLVLMDSGGNGTQLEVPFHEPSSGTMDQDHMSSWAVSREIQPGKYTIADFNYMKPRVPWSGDQPIAQSHALAEKFEMYDYPGGEYDDALNGADSDPKWIEQYAKTRIEELHARYEQFSGGGNERRCAPGALLKLKRHDSEHYNTDYLVTAVSYAASAGDLASSGGAGAEFRCSVSAIAAGAVFRPARITPKPVIQGPQTAIVADWEEADGLGRVKVKFHWFQGCASCWVRVAQPLAGNKWGFLGLPRVGDEVVVEFLEGDPDRPIVTGSVYNAASMPPYKLPTDRTRTGFKSLSWGSSGGFNELRFDDKQDNEEIYIRAEKDKTIRVERHRTEWVGKESHLIVKDKVFEDFGAEHHVKVKSDRNEDIGGSLSLKVKDGVHAKMDLLAYEANNEIHLKAGSTLVLEAGSTLSLKVGGNFITIDSSGVAIKGTMVQINSGGAAGTGSGAKTAAVTAAKEAHKSEGGAANEAPAMKTVAASKMTADMTKVTTPQAQMFKSAAESGTPFCEICNC